MRSRPPEEGSGKALRDVSLSVRDFPSRSDGRQPEGRQRRTRAALPRNRDSGRYRYIPYVPRFRRKTKRFFAFLRNCGEMKMYFHFAHMALVRRRKAPTLRQRTRKRCSGSCPRSKACATTTRKRCCPSTTPVSNPTTAYDASTRLIGCWGRSRRRISAGQTSAALNARRPLPLGDVPFC